LLQDLAVATVLVLLSAFGLSRDLVAGKPYHANDKSAGEHR